jgi:Uma2 family endonuclease
VASEEEIIRSPLPLSGNFMATKTTSEPDTLADLLRQLGNVPTKRILWRPHPGTATEKDLLRYLDAADKRLVELIDGVLVEKTLGHQESQIGGVLLQYFNNYLDEHDLGVAYTADAPFRILPKQIRLPDVSFATWETLGGRMPSEPIVGVAPELAVEVLSKSNTKGEMNRKRRDYFLAGVRELWIIDPKTQTAEVYTSPEDKRSIAVDGSLTGGDILPGFSLPLKKLFARINRGRV